MCRISSQTNLERQNWPHVLSSLVSCEACTLSYTCVSTVEKTAVGVVTAILVVTVTSAIV